MTIDISPEAKAGLEVAAAVQGQEPRGYLEAVVDKMFASSTTNSFNNDSPTDWTP